MAMMMQVANLTASGPAQAPNVSKNSLGRGENV